MDPIQPGGRDLLLAALPITLASAALASPLNPAQTTVRPPAEHACDTGLGNRAPLDVAKPGWYAG